MKQVINVPATDVEFFSDSLELNLVNKTATVQIVKTIGTERLRSAVKVDYQTIMDEQEFTTAQRNAVKKFLKAIVAKSWNQDIIILNDE